MIKLSLSKGAIMLNKDGFERDLAILKEWEDSMTPEEYQEKLQEIFSDYGIDSEGK